MCFIYYLIIIFILLKYIYLFVYNRCLVFPFPAPSAAYNTLGLIARDLGDLKEALGYFEKAIEGVSPQHPFWGVITGNIDITKDMMKTLH